MNSIEDGSTAPDDQGTVILSTSELNYGDRINAFYKGTLVHRGYVTDIAPHHELFWIMDHLTGGRRLLDVSEFRIVRASMHADAGGALTSMTPAPPVL